MSKGEIFKSDLIDTSTFTFTNVKPNSFGGKGAFVHSDKHNVRIETPLMMCRWGLSTYPPNDPNPTAFSLQLHFPENPDEKMKKFNQALEMYDTITMKTAQERSKDWLQRPALTDVQAVEYYTPLLIKSKDANGVPDGKFPDSFRLKLPYKDGVFTTKCFGKNKEKANIREIVQKGCYIKAIMQLNGVNLKKNAYSSSASALQIRVFPATRLTGYAFLPDEDDDENTTVTAPVVNTPVSTTVADEVVEDNSGDGDDTPPVVDEVVESPADPEPESPVVEKKVEAPVQAEEPQGDNSDEIPSPQPKKKTKFTGRGKK